jgi:hypothetical protein
MPGGTLEGQPVISEPGESPSNYKVVLVAGISTDGTIQPLGGQPTEQQTTVTVNEDGGNESVLNTANLGWDPEDYHLQIQFTAVGAGSATLEAKGPAGTWTSIQPSDPATFGEDDIAQLVYRYEEVKVVWAGTGGSAVAHVRGYRP